MEEQSRCVCPGPAGLKECGLDWWCVWKNSPDVCVSRACQSESVWFGLVVCVQGLPV